MVSVNTNVNALQSQDASRRASSSLAKSMERLSTGIKINSAADDAAGLAISNRMTSLVRGTSMAIKNVMDGISLAQTADGALGQISNILQRMRELSVQASTDTMTDKDRAALNQETMQLKQEINHIADETRFNGIKLLDGNLSKLPIQSGANRDEKINLGVSSAHTEVLGTTLSKKDLNKVILTFSGGYAAEGERVFVGGVPVDLPEVDITISDESSYWNTKIADSVNSALRTSEKFKDFSVRAIGNSVVISAESGVTIPEIELINTANTDIKMGIVSAENSQFTATSHATTLGFTAGPYPAGHIITVAGVDIALTAYVAGADATVTSWNHRVAEDVRVALLGNEKFSKYVIERNGNTLLVISPNSKILDVDKFSDFGGQNIDMTVDGGSGIINGVNYGNNPFKNFIGTTRNSALTFTGGEFSRGGYVKIGDTQIALPTYDPTVSLDPQYWNDLVAETIRLGLDASSEFDDYFFKRIDNNLLVFVSSNAEPVEFSLVNSSDSQIAMAIDTPTQNLATTSSTLRVEEFQTNIAGLERVTRFSGRSLSSIDLLSRAAAHDSLSTIDAAIDAVSLSQAQIGAFLNRLERAADNLSEYLTNSSASRSRILDADYAKETVDLAKNQIISQAALAMLAQANQSSQSVLALLGNR
jgi:flagellin